METETDINKRLEGLLEEGQVFLAQDLARRHHDEMRSEPKFLGLYALSLIRSGALETAESVLATVSARAGLDEDADRSTFAALSEALHGAGAADEREIEDIRRRLDVMQTAIVKVMGRHRGVALSPDAIIVLGDCYVELFRRTREPRSLERALALFEDAARASRQARPAAMARMLRLAAGRAPAADEPDAELAADHDRQPHDAFWRAVLEACVALEADEPARAVERFAAARGLARATSHRTTVIRELLQTFASLSPQTGEQLTAIFKSPRIVVFAGAPFDRPDAPQGCPPSAEGAMRDAIRAKLADMDAGIGYASASCGADLLFIEAMLERDAEVNIVLPFEREDFEAERVGYLGPIWRRRFDIALKLANSVTYATPGPYLGDDALYRFGNQALQGAAIMRGRQFDVAPDLLTVWDMTPGGEIGGVSDFIDKWADMTRLHIIDLDDLRPTPPTAPAAPTIRRGSREIRALLMSDIVGSSRLTEAQMPNYAAFLNRIAERLAADAPTPTFANTWGDAVFATSPSALDLARYALTLKAAVVEYGDLDGALQTPLQMRISLNAGPVLETADAIAGRLGNFGAEIVRAARIEPVTTPNQIYATDPFVSLLLAEENEAKTQAETEGENWASIFEIQYIGRVTLAKNAGAEGLHHLSAAPGAA
ncbi:MAG: hypothetical protein AAF360_03010 [Pseudomonadota bacterium]